MIQQDIVDALNGRLAAFPDAPDIAWDDYTPREGVPYLSPRLSSYTCQGVGAGVEGAEQHDGTYTVVVYRSADEGRQPAGILAGQVKAWFSRGTLLLTSDLEPVILLQASEQQATFAGPWISIPVLVTFTAAR